MRSLVAILLCLPIAASAATYYMRADGTAANKGAATGPASTQSACMSMATHNGQTFSGGDTILLSSQGGDYTANLNTPSSGSAGSLIAYDAVPSELPKLRNAEILGNGKSYLSFANIWITNNNGNAGVEMADSCGFVTLSNLLIRLGAGGYYVLCYGANSTNITIQNLTAAGADSVALYFFSGIPTNIVVRDCTMTNGAGMYFINAGNLTISNVYFKATGAYGMRATNGAGTFAITGLTIDGTGDQDGIYMPSGSTCSGGMTNCTVLNPFLKGYNITGLTNFNFDHCVSSNATLGFGLYSCSNTVLNTCQSLKSRSDNGIYLATTYNATLRNCISRDGGVDGFNSWEGSVTNLYISCLASNNAGDGFSANDGAATRTHDLYYTNCITWGNGDKASTANGDGFTSHTTNYNLFFVNCLSVSNRCSGAAMVNYSSGYFINCLFYHNAGNWTGSGGVDEVRGGFYSSLQGANTVTGNNWQLTNCVFVGNYPGEINVNVTPPFDYNAYIPLANNNFTVNGASTWLSWNTYHGSYEPHSFTNSTFGFFNATADFHPVWTSPLINSGISVAMRSADFDGNKVVGVPDIGPYEYRAIPTMIVMGRVLTPVRNK